MSNYPLTLPHSHIRRILDHKATILILSRRLPATTHELHDALAVQRNAKHRRNGRPDLQQDPHAFTIQVESIDTIGLLDLDLATIIAAGYPTSEDFYLDWLSRRRRIVSDLKVHTHHFHIASDARYLHVRVHRAYTTDPGRAIPGEPQALSRDELNKLTEQAAERREQQLAGDLFEQRGRSIGIRIKDASRRRDISEISALTAELVALSTNAVFAGTI